jgi:hypothetical protein
VLGIERRLAPQHGAGHGQQSISEDSQRAAVAVTTLAQFGVARAAADVVLDGDARPMVDGGAA